MEKLAAAMFGMLALFAVATGGDLDVVARYRPVVRRERASC